MKHPCPTEETPVQVLLEEESRLNSILMLPDFAGERLIFKFKIGLGKFWLPLLGVFMEK